MCCTLIKPLNPKTKLWILICCPTSFPTEVVGRSYYIKQIHLVWSCLWFSWPLCFTKHWYYKEKFEQFGLSLGGKSPTNTQLIWTLSTSPSMSILTGFDPTVHKSVFYYIHYSIITIIIIVIIAIIIIIITITKFSNLTGYQLPWFQP